MTFADSSEMDSSFGLPKIDEDFDQEKGSPGDTGYQFFTRKRMDDIESYKIMTGT